MSFYSCPFLSPIALRPLPAQLHSTAMNKLSRAVYFKSWDGGEDVRGELPSFLYV